MKLKSRDIILIVSLTIFIGSFVVSQIGFWMLSNNYITPTMALTINGGAIVGVVSGCVMTMMSGYNKFEERWWE